MKIADIAIGKAIVAKTGPERGSMDAESPGGLRKRHTVPSTSHPSSVTAILCLFLRVGPTHVSRFVSSLIVNTINAVLQTRRITDVFVKSFKGLFPFWPHWNVMIIKEILWISRSSCPVLDAYPSSVDLCAVHPVFDGMLASIGELLAPTTFNPALSKTRADYASLSSTVADADPFSLSFTFWISPQYNEVSQSFTSHVDSCKCSCRRAHERRILP